LNKYPLVPVVGANNVIDTRNPDKFVVNTADMENKLYTTYHSCEWAGLVSRGWVTHEVLEGEQLGRIAVMVCCPVHRSYYL